MKWFRGLDHPRRARRAARCCLAVMSARTVIRVPSAMPVMGLLASHSLAHMRAQHATQGRRATALCALLLMTRNHHLVATPLAATLLAAATLAATTLAVIPDPAMYRGPAMANLCTTMAMCRTPHPVAVAPGRLRMHLSGPMTQLIRDRPAARISSQVGKQPPCGRCTNPCSPLYTLRVYCCCVRHRRRVGWCGCHRGDICYGGVHTATRNSVRAHQHCGEFLWCS